MTDQLVKVASAKLEGDVLVIRVPLHAPTLSSSGKTHNVANATLKSGDTGIKVEGCPLTIGVNCYVKGYRGPGMQ
jgi:hypothetical protein